MRKRIMYVASPYGVPVYLFRNRDDFRSAASKWDSGREFKLEGRGICAPFRGRENGLILSVGWFTDELCALVHETAHATFFILDSRGVVISQENDEAFTYLQEDMFRFFERFK